MISDRLRELRLFLSTANVPQEEAEILMREAQAEIDSAVRSIVADAVEEAKGVAEGMEAWEFLDQITLNANSGDLQIGTESGNLDFSTPPTPMLPWLLKNAKTSKTGHQYARIPIGKSKGESVPVKDVSAGADAIRKKSSMVDSTLEIAQAFGVSASKMQRKIKDPSPAVAFVTAGSWQDADTMWKKPGKDKDMRSDIDGLNERIRQQIQSVCDEVISRYRR